MSGYGDAAPLYWQAGWRSPLPLPPNTKKSPPAGWTGYSGATPSYPDIAAWCEQHAGGNLALRLPDTVIGIDVDHYDDKHGGDTLTHAGQLWGELPPTVRTTSRTDEHSGIRLYRVPASTRLRTVLDFPDQNLGDIEIVQHFHRYAIAWPSIHPNGRQYRWIWPDGRETDQIPAIDDLPELPQTWLDALALLADVIELGGKVDTDAALEHLPQGPPTGRVIDRLTAAIKDLSEGGSRHDTTTRHVLALLRFSEQGDTGDDRDQRGLGRGHRGSGDLGLVAHLGDEERDHGGAEYTEATDVADFGAIELVGDQRPRRHRDEQYAQHPAQHAGAGHAHDPGAGGAGQCVVGEGRDQDAEDDRQRLAEARGEDEGQQLRLVADLGDGDGTGGGEESGHGRHPAGKGRMTTTLPRPAGGVVVDGLARCGIARATADVGQAC